MRVVSRGVLPEDRLCQGTCPKCKSVIEAKQPELREGRDERDGMYRFGHCPVCNELMSFTPLPPPVQLITLPRGGSGTSKPVKGAKQ